MEFEQLVNAINMHRGRIDRVWRWVSRAMAVMLAAYVAATGVSAYLMTGLLSKAVLIFNRQASAKAVVATLNISGSTANYRDIEKAIRDRNLFNNTGEFPDEKHPLGGGDEKKASAFDINAPCGKPTINAELVGTIYLQSGGSVATLQEKGYSESDIYREGDLIIGSEQASIVKIERNRVILNNNGLKECLTLAVELPKRPGDGFPVGTAPPTGANPTATAPGVPGEVPATTECMLDEKYVQDELGPGFGTIIQKARLVPNTADNQMNGFKIFAIEQASLLGRTGLQNGDVITQVNETSLKQPEQGFALYQAFQDEKEVRIHILRRGTQAMMLTCRIK